MHGQVALYGKRDDESSSFSLHREDNKRFDLPLSLLQQLCDTLPTREVGIIKKELNGYVCLYASVKVKVKLS